MGTPTLMAALKNMNNSSIQSMGGQISAWETSTFDLQICVALLRYSLFWPREASTRVTANSGHNACSLPFYLSVEGHGQCHASIGQFSPLHKGIPLSCRVSNISF